MTGRVLVGGLLLLLGGGCVADADHSNPLDPLSDAYLDAGSVAGSAQDLLFRPVDGEPVRLTHLAADSVTYVSETRSDGSFEFDLIPTGNYLLRLAPVGFIAHEESLTVPIGSLADVGNVSLNALPVVTHVSMQTIHVSRWWPEDDLYLLDVAIGVSDPDERPGIDSVWIAFEDAGVTFRLPPGLQPGNFARIVPADSLPAGSVHALVGEPVRARIKDRDANLVEHEVAGPIRVLDQTPVALEPQGLAIVSDPRPTLSWAPLDLPFPMTYRIEVIRDEANTDVLVQEYDGIPADSLSFRLQSGLSAGSYYWTVAVVDAYGNLSRSKEAGFRVN